MKFNIITLGCKVNLYESEIIKENLIKEHYLFTEKKEEADILIINTCSVTNMADHKSMKMVRMAKRLNKIVVVCGCSSENKQEEYEKLGIDILLGNKDKSKIHIILKEFLEKRKKVVKFYKEKELPFEDMCVEKFNSHTRSFVKIQDGCNNFCSYCIIPYVRKNIRNKDFNKAISEIKTLVENGHQEIVLTGIHTGSYFDQNHDLADLIHEISKIKDLKRIRISSIEVTELNDKMLKEIEENEKVANHFHIPLQTGSDEILKRMNRKYDLNYYKEKINEIRKRKKDVSVTTDVIVGHPYETGELFLKTIETCKEIGFSKIHVFPYSKRDGTPSSKMPMQVDDSVKKNRSRILNHLSKTLESEFYKRFLGTTLEVLIEQVYGEESIGFTSNYIKIKVLKPLEKNKFYTVHVMNYQNGVLIGEIEKVGQKS